MRARSIFLITGLALAPVAGALAADSATQPATTLAPPPKAWSPPDIIPAQPNWTWMRSDGTTYHNVVVTKIGPETVSISHAMGVAHDIPIGDFPPDIQKQLNYDPAAATAARKERAREAAHPYFAINELTAAQDLARQLHRPLAWIDGIKADLTVADPVPESQADFTQRDLNRLKTWTIVVWLEGDDEAALWPVPVRDQLFTMDDGPLPGGGHFYAPKVVLTDSNITMKLGRISYTQIKTLGNSAVDNALSIIPTSASAIASSNSPSTNAVTNSASAASASTASPPNPVATVTPPAAPLPTWTPPAVLPAQPNWTWTTSDGTTYENVVVTKIKPKTVSITHSKGVAHDIPIANLPLDVQKQLNYMPKAPKGP